MRLVLQNTLGFKKRGHLDQRGLNTDKWHRHANNHQSMKQNHRYVIEFRARNTAKKMSKKLIDIRQLIRRPINQR